MDTSDGLIATLDQLRASTGSPSGSHAPRRSSSTRGPQRPGSGRACRRSLSSASRTASSSSYSRFPKAGALRSPPRPRGSTGFPWRSASPSRDAGSSPATGPSTAPASEPPLGMQGKSGRIRRGACRTGLKEKETTDEDLSTAAPPVRHCRGRSDAGVGGCATVILGTHQDVRVETEPPGAIAPGEIIGSRHRAS